MGLTPRGITDGLHRPDVVVLIDGRSGAGKSTFADLLVSRWPGGVTPTLVRMDDIYPGWSGLDAASQHVQSDLLVPRAAGRPARWRRHDWVRDRAAEWHDVPADRPLVIEGCGVLTRANASAASLRIWLEAEPAVRKKRALTRDAGAFDGHWDMWTDQMESFVVREDPIRSADIVLRNDGGEAAGWLDEMLHPSIGTAEETSAQPCWRSAIRAEMTGIGWVIRHSTPGS